MYEGEEKSRTDTKSVAAPNVASVQPLIDYIPPWKEARYSQKLRLLAYAFLIYMPVALLIAVIVGVFGCYYGLLLWPMAMEQSDRPELYFWHTNSEHKEARTLACLLGSVQMVLLVLFMISFYRASTTNPGCIPDDDMWEVPDKLTEESAQAKVLMERKLTTGAIRTCARCNRVKPDRCHHCRLCDQCVLKMDHHCPWISNCVGFYNYKYFFLMVTYGMIALWLFVATFWMTVVVVLRNNENSMMHAFLVSVIYLLCGVLCLALTLFWCFHMYLITHATTTVEFCEKRTRTHDTSPSPFLGSFYFNLKAAFGPQPFLWLVPFCKRHPDYRGADDNGTLFLKPAN